MRFIVDVNPSGDQFEILINAATPSTRGEHHQIVDKSEIGASIGVVVDRIMTRRLESTDALPAEMRMVDALIEWTATSIVKIPVLRALESDDDVRESIRHAIKRDGLPEVVINPTIEFMHASTAYFPADGDMDSEKEIDIS